MRRDTLNNFSLSLERSAQGIVVFERFNLNYRLVRKKNLRNLRILLDKPSRLPTIVAQSGSKWQKV